MKKIFLTCKPFFLLSFLVHLITINILAQEARNYTDEQLFKNGLKEYKDNNYKAAAIYLYAYIQKKQGQISGELSNAYKFSLDKIINGESAGAKGDGFCECEIKKPSNRNKPGLQDNNEGATTSISIKSFGHWTCNDGGTYYIRQVGTEVWWYGQSSDNGKSWSNVMHGQISGNQIIGKWSDVSHGDAKNFGDVTLEIVNNLHLKATNITGGFGGSDWTATREIIKDAATELQKTKQQKVSSKVIRQ